MKMPHEGSRPTTRGASPSSKMVSSLGESVCFQMSRAMSLLPFEVSKRGERGSARAGEGGEPSLRDVLNPRTVGREERRSRVLRGLGVFVDRFLRVAEVLQGHTRVKRGGAP